MRKDVVITVFLIILLSNLAYGDFTAIAAKETIEACHCSLYDNDILLKNTGTGASEYTLSQQGTATVWSTLYPQIIALSEGGTEKVYGNLKIPCGVSGNYDLKTIIKESSGLEKEINQNIIVGKCSYTEVIAESNFIEMCPCSERKLSIKVKNTGDFKETYDFSLDKGPEFILKISSPTITLEPGEEKEVTLYFDSQCGYHGMSSIVLNILSRTSGESRDIRFDVNVMTCYGYDALLGENLNRDVKISEIAGKDEYFICEGQTTRIPFVITNKAYITNDYKLSLTAPSYANLRAGEIKNLSKNSSFISYIDVAPDQYYISDDIFKLTIETVIGSEKKELQAQVHVVNCNTPEFDVKSYRYTGYYDDYMPLTVKNSGYNNVTYKISLEGPDWIKIIDKEKYAKVGKVKFSRGESKDFLIAIKAGENVSSGNYKTYLSLEAEGQDSPYTKEIDIRLRRESLGTKTYSFLMMNWWKLLIILIILIILLIYIRRWLRDRKARPERLEPLSRQDISEKKDYGIFWAILIILVIIAVFFLAWKFTPKGYDYVNETSVSDYDNETTIDLNNCTFTSNGNEPITINLSTSFMDPDGDELQFYYNNTPIHSTIKISGDIAAIYPKEGYVGKDQIQFIADDGKGGIIRSGQITVCFEKGDTGVQWGKLNDAISSYLYYIIAGIIILVIVIVIMIINERPVEEEIEEIPQQPKKKKKKQKR